LSTSAAEAVPIKRAISLGITILVPFCGLGLCQTQTHSLFNTPVGSPQCSTLPHFEDALQAGTFIYFSFCVFFIIHLLTCAYIVWGISPPWFLPPPPPPLLPAKTCSVLFFSSVEE
jgi:hypothetical protein